MPHRIQLRMKIRHSPDFSTLRIRFNSHVLKELFLNSEKLEHQLTLNDFLLPSGGHHLHFDLSPGGPEVIVSELCWQASIEQSEQLTEELPFDLYQRYRIAAELARAVEATDILDVGGYIGDRFGHLAVSQDFFAPNQHVQSTDLRQCDHPFHDPANALSQPFAQESFDLVLTLDVLEHLPSSKRRLFLEELDRLARRWIILGAPFYTEDVESIEQLLSQSIHLTFLNEHRTLGLPRHSLIHEFFGSERGYEVMAFPNGFLPRWAEMQILTQQIFSMRDHEVAREVSRLYNRNFFEADQRHPAYRTVYLVAKTPVDTVKKQELAHLFSEAPSDEECLDAMVREGPFSQSFEKVVILNEERNQALTDVQFLANSRQQLIQILEKEKASLRRELDETPLWKLARRRWRKRRQK